MASSESLNIVRTRLGERIAEIEAHMPRLKASAIEARMDAIRAIAADHGLGALEGLADYGAHHARLPGHRTATRACLAQMETALVSEDGARDRESVLAALALRLH